MVASTEQERTVTHERIRKTAEYSVAAHISARLARRNRIGQPETDIVVEAVHFQQLTFATNPML